MMPALPSWLAVFFLTVSAADGPAKPFAIRVVDEATGRGVPMIELRTVDAARFVTDNAGLVAFDEPGLMDTEVFFGVGGHGYDYPADGFGYKGVRLRPTRGGEATVKIKRLNVAERIYRVTGGGLYRDSLLLGRPTPLKNPAINALVLGQDSVVNALVRGETLYWFWGDTNRPSYPLGNFHVPGATSKLPARGGLDPDLGVDLAYFVDKDGFARPTAQFPGDGPTWIFGVAVTDTEAGRGRIFGSYVKARGGLEVYEHGAAEFDEGAKSWIKRATWPEKAPNYPGGQAAPITDGDGRRSIYFARDLPNLRVAATSDSYLDLAQYEAWTPLKPGSTPEKPEVEVGADGRPVLGWKRGTPALAFDVQEKLVRDGKIRPEEAPIVLRDVATGKPIRPHTSSLDYNEYRRAWSLIVLEMGGTSMLGEVWYAEADHPAGPFVYARKVASHNDYSFYNPRLHPYFKKDGGRRIYFEGTYTTMFSGAPSQTPRYDYNQIMYRLDLGDSRVNLPLPAIAIGPEPGRAPFFAPRSGGPGLVSFVVGPKGRLERGETGGRDVKRLYLIDPGAKSFPPATVPVVESIGDDGRHVYEAGPAAGRPGLKQTGRTIGRAWPNPTALPTPTLGPPAP